MQQCGFKKVWKILLSSGQPLRTLNLVLWFVAPISISLPSLRPILRRHSLWTAPNSRNWRKNVHLNAFYFLGILWILRNISLLHSICTWTSSTYSFSFWGSLEAPIITKKDKVWIKGAFRPKLPVFIVCTSLICTYVGNMLYTLTRYVYIFEFKEIENTYFERCFCLRKCFNGC